MADLNLGDGLRKIVLAGIGALATTYEKSSEIVDELVKKGEITVEQFAANFNRSASQLSTQNAGKLTRDGVWTSRDTNTFLLMNVPPFGYETDENGRLQSVCIEADGGAAFGARPTGLMQLALYAFAGAQKGHICFNRAIMAVTKRLKAQPQEAFSTIVDGVAVDYQYRAEGNCYRLMMTKTGVDK